MTEQLNDRNKIQTQGHLTPKAWLLIPPTVTGIEQWFSKCVPQNSSSSTWTLVSNTSSQTPPRPSASETLGAAICVLISPPGDSDAHSSLRFTGKQMLPGPAEGKSSQASTLTSDVFG